MKIEQSPDEEIRFTIDGKPLVYVILGKMAFLNDIREITLNYTPNTRKSLEKIFRFLESQQIHYEILKHGSTYSGIHIWGKDYRVNYYRCV